MKMTVEFDSPDELCAFILFTRERSANENKLRLRDDLTKEMLQKWEESELGAIGWPPRLEQALREMGVTTIDEALAIPENGWICLPNFGRKSLRELKAMLNHYAEKKKVDTTA